MDFSAKLPSPVKSMEETTGHEDQQCGARKKDALQIRTRVLNEYLSVLFGISDVLERGKRSLFSVVSEGNIIRVLQDHPQDPRRQQTRLQIKISPDGSTFDKQTWWYGPRGTAESAIEDFVRAANRAADERIIHKD